MSGQETTRRVVVTGIGVVAPTGLGKRPFWDAIIHGPSVVGPITRFDAAAYATRIAAEIRDAGYQDLIPPQKRRTTTLATQYALAATELALRDARVDLECYAPWQRGVVLGTSGGGWYEAQQQVAILLERGAGRVNPFLTNGSANNVAAMEVAVATRSEGTHATLATGCCASMHAIGHAVELIRRGEIECCITGGTEAPISPLVIAAMSRTHELSCSNDDPQHASRPFDRGHNGAVLSEGSAIFVLEHAERALARGAPIYAEALAHTSAMDATDVFKVEQSGVAGARAVESCLRRSGLAPSDLDYVCAHGNSLPHFDRKETIVLKRALGAVAKTVPVSSIKGVLGHPFGASAAFQVAAVSLALQHHLIPPTYNFEEPDPECDLDYVPNRARPAHLRNVLVCSYGFGGLNAYLVLKAPAVGRADGI